jgi:hypothetical protein
MVNTHEYRVEFRGNTGDRNLIAKFFHAVNKTECAAKALAWLALPAGVYIRLIITEV